MTCTKKGRFYKKCVYIYIYIYIYSEDVRVTSGVPQGSVLGPLLFLAYVNDIWRNIESKIRLFANDRIIYRQILNIKDAENLQTDLGILGGIGRKEMK